MDKKYNLKIIGNFFGIDGYSSHTRQLFNALANRNDTNVKIETQLPENWLKIVNDNELDAITKEDNSKFDNLIISLPHMWKLFTGLNKNYAYVIWEGDSVPCSWIEEFLNPKIDLIFVPSNHTKKAIEKTLYEGWTDYLTDEFNDKYLLDKIKVIPHGVDRSIFHSQQMIEDAGGSVTNVALKPGKEKSPPLDAGTFKFICNKGWRGTSWDRGGVQYLIKAFAEEFKKDEKVQLILKLNPAYIKPEQISQAIQQLNLPEDRAQININCDAVPFDKLPLLYNQANCFVCATRAEAFNLPGMEAMACGLPTIQTLFGGQIDYMNPDNSRGILYDLEEVKEDVMYEEAKWATPKIESIRENLRWAFNNQDKIKEMGKYAEEDSKQWTWDKSAENILSVL